MSNNSTKISFNNVTYDSNSYSQVVNTSFTQLGVKSIPQQIEEQPTVNEFFDMYNQMFYNIPETGEINSHEYIIQKSSDYIGFNPNQEELLALQNEISQLRQELLDAQKQLVNLQSSTSNQI